MSTLRTWADTGDKSTAMGLADLLAQRDDIDELRARADTGDGSAAEWLADLLAEHGDIDELRARADTGDWCAANRLADLLAGRGHLEELRARTDVGDETAGWRLIDLLTGRAEVKKLNGCAALVTYRASGSSAAHRLTFRLCSRARGQHCPACISVSGGVSGSRQITLQDRPSSE